MYKKEYENVINTLITHGIYSVIWWWYGNMLYTLKMSEWKWVAFASFGKLFYLKVRDDSPFISYSYNCVDNFGGTIQSLKNVPRCFDKVLVEEKSNPIFYD